MQLKGVWRWWRSQWVAVAVEMEMEREEKGKEAHKCRQIRALTSAICHPHTATKRRRGRGNEFMNVVRRHLAGVLGATPPMLLLSSTPRLLLVPHRHKHIQTHTHTHTHTRARAHTKQIVSSLKSW